MKKSNRARTRQAQPMRRKKDEGRLTTTEISRLREQKRMRRNAVTAVIGLALMGGGIAMYLSPDASASDEVIVYEMDDSNIVDGLEFTDADFAFGTALDEQAQAEASTPHPDFLSLSEDDARARAEVVSDDDLPADGAYDPTTLLIDMASDTTQDDATALAADLGCEIKTMLSESDGRFGASFSVTVPEGKGALDVYRAALASPKVYHCGFNLIYETMSVQTDDAFILNGADSWSDGIPNEESDLSVSQLGDTSVFDDPDETFVDLNAEGDAGLVLSAESVGGYDTVEDSDESISRWEYKQLDYEKVWHSTKANGRVTVGVVDTGIRASHADLKNLIHNPIVVSDDGKVTEVAANQIEDPSSMGHGTSVAGIIAAQANNRFGISGLSYNARLMPIQLSHNESGTMTAEAVKAAFCYVSEGNKLTNAQRNNVRVLNVSLGLPVDQQRAEGWKKDLTKPLAQLEDSGTLVVVAAGNQNANASVPFLSVPAYDPADNVISVINLEPDASNPDSGAPHRKNTSNYNQPGRHDHEISAPGTNIYSTHNKNDNAYARLTGTSQAAPIVSATAALMFSANPNLTPKQVKQIICDTATDLGVAGWDDETGYGEINPVAAVAKAKEGAQIDQSLNIGKSNSRSLINLKAFINGQEYPAFDYRNVAYEIEYNGLRDNMLETSFHFEGVPSGLEILRRVSDPEYGEEMEDATTGRRYREVRQTVTFLFAGQNAQLTDTNALHGIYAFNIKYDLVTGTMGGEAAANAEGGDEAVAEGTGDLRQEDPVQADFSKVLDGTWVKVTPTGDVITEFDPAKAFVTQKLHVKSYNAVNGDIQIMNLPEGYAASVEAVDEGHVEEQYSRDDIDSDVFRAYVKTCNISISNYTQSQDYPIQLYTEAIDDTTNARSSNLLSAQEHGDVSSGIRTDDASNSGSRNNQARQPMEYQQTTQGVSYVAQSANENFTPYSETPTSDFKELKGMQCMINNKPYKEFQYEKTTYIIQFKLGSTLPMAPSLTNVPAGWAISSSTQSELPQSQKYPFGGKKYTFNVAKGTLSRQYVFVYSLYSSGDGTATQAGAALQQQTTSNTQVQTSDSGTETKTLEVESLTGQQTETVNAANQGGTNGRNGNAGANGSGNASSQGTQGKQTQQPSGVVSESRVDANTGRTITDASPASAFISGGTLTQTGDAVVIASGGIIALASLAGLATAYKRMKLAV